MRQEPYKVYGNVHPATTQLLEAVKKILYEYNIDECLELDGDILRISFEGVFFPVEETVALLHSYATDGYIGKLDVLDLEEWTLHRTIFNGINITTSKVSLNHVLDYSGH